MGFKIGSCASNFDGAFQLYEFILSWVESIKCEVFYDNQFLQWMRCWYINMWTIAKNFLILS